MTRNAALIVLLTSVLLPQASARYCYYDRYGYRRCSVLSPGARAGIGIAIALVGLLFICLALFLRRRRIQRANKAFITQGGQQPHQPAFYQPNQPVSNQPLGGYGNQQAGTQYPAAVHAPTGQTNAGTKAYAPPSGPPPEAGNSLGKPPSYAGANV